MLIMSPTPLYCEGEAKATQSHPQATLKPPQSLLIANRLRPQSHSKATLKLPPSHPRRIFQNLGGAETTSFP